MKVIFIKDLKKQGRVNEIKEVSDGYATNFLIKNGYAVKYTKTSSKILDQNIEEKRNIDEQNKNEVKITEEEIMRLVAEELKEDKPDRLVGADDVKKKFKKELDEYLERTQEYL